MKTIKNKIRAAVVVVAIVLLSTACMKDFLDIKRDKSQVLPVILEDYRSIFENQLMNSNYPMLGEIGSDDYYIMAPQWNGLSNVVQKNAYIWDDEIYEGEQSIDWNRCYEKILYANFVLEGVGEIRETPANKPLRDELIGAAHFFRGTNLFLLAQLFCKQYDSQTANNDLGLPLRVTSSINTNYQRANLQETYNRIIDDLQTAAQLLPINMSLNTRPYRVTAMGMLANVHLQMGDYQLALNAGNAALPSTPDILDYNQVNVSANAPFPQYGRTNVEVIFLSLMSNAAILAPARLTVDSLLYDFYHENDLRKQAFFSVNNGRNTIKAGYTGTTSVFFTGLTTTELVLVRAECNVRLGNIEDSIADLNRLLSNRFKPEDFVPIGNDISQGELLSLVLLERRKELIFRGKRWHDLKRFGKDTSLAKPLMRVLGDDVYNLPVNSAKWVWPIPHNAVQLGGLVQNDR